MKKFNFKSLAIILVVIICIGGIVPSQTQAKSYLGHKLLTKHISTKGTLKWKIKNMYLKKATYKKALSARGHVTLGNATSDNVKINGTITSTLGAVEVNDDMHVTGTLTLDTPLEANAIADTAVVKSLTAGDNMIITDNGSGNYSLAATDTNSGSGTTYTAGTGISIADAVISASLGTSVGSSELDADAVTAAALTSTAIESGDIEAADLPSDGYASTYVNTSGDTLTGALNITGGSLLDNGVVRQLAAQLNIPDAGATITLDSAIGSLAGSQPMAVTVGTDGMPIVVYWDEADGDVTVVHCTSRSCSSTDSAVDIDTTSSNRSDVAIMIGSDGLPFIVYFDADDFDTTAVHCSSKTCATSTLTDIDNNSSGFSGGYSVIVGTDGFPIISYFDGDGGNNVMLNHCTNASCTSSSTAVEVDSDVGSSIVTTSMVMNIGGMPMIAYGDATDQDVTIVLCTTSTCSTVGAPTDIDSTVDNPATLSLTVNALGNPMLAYYDSTDSDLTVYFCVTYDCANGSSSGDIDTTATAGSVTIAINPINKLPVILYGDSSDSIVHMVTCQSNTCNDTFPNVTTVYSAGIFGGDMTFGSDGNPLLLYSDPATDTVKLQQCSNAYCQDYWTRR